MGRRHRLAESRSAAPAPGLRRLALRCRGQLSAWWGAAGNRPRFAAWVAVLATTATVPGRPDYDNEDFVAASHNTIVLLDGAGTPVGSESGCRHGVAWYSRHLGTTLLNLATDQAALPLRDAHAASIDQVASLHRETCDLAHPGSRRRR